MSLYPCAGCEQRQPGKLITVYWAWQRADSTRYACKQRLCKGCTFEALSDLGRASIEAVTHCPACGIDTVEDMDPVYATVFMPGADRIDLELAMCASCAVPLRDKAQRNCSPLEDRRQAVGGPESSPQPPNDAAFDPWLGLRGGR